MRKPLHALVFVVAASVALAACGSDGTTQLTATSSTVPAQASFGDADVAFAQGMIPHHSQAVDMAALALKQSSNPAILDLAARIQGAQDPEITQMRGWLTTWGQQEMTADMEGMDMGSVDGMMDDTEMGALSDATGPAFDALFVDMMIRHHQGAIAMAKTVLADGAEPHVRALAEAIITAQEGEITEMQALDVG